MKTHTYTDEFLDKDMTDWICECGWSTTLPAGADLCCCPDCNTVENLDEDGFRDYFIRKQTKILTKLLEDFQESMIESMEEILTKIDIKELYELRIHKESYSPHPRWLWSKTIILCWVLEQLRPSSDSEFEMFDKIRKKFKITTFY